ncbi:MAG: hypothetical protein ACR2IE_02255 [Candidatus Sumerlaeaceae bacterium]
MAMKVTHETATVLAASLDDSEFKESIVSSLDRKDYTMALVVCGEAVSQTLRRETDLSVEELKLRMRNCSKLEKLEHAISVLARELRAAARERKAAARSARFNNTWTGMQPPEERMVSPARQQKPVL